MEKLLKFLLYCLRAFMAVQIVLMIAIRFLHPDMTDIRFFIEHRWAFVTLIGTLFIWAGAEMQQDI